MNESAGQLHLNVDVNASTSEKWEEMLDLIAGVFNIRCALVTHVLSNDIEVFARSNNADNIYHLGAKAQLGTGLYCETVIQTRQMLNISNALNQSQMEKQSGYCIWHDLVFGSACFMAE